MVDDYFFPMYVITPRPGTTRIQVWHAAGAFKKFGYSVVDKSFGADEDLIRSVDIHSNYSLALVLRDVRRAALRGGVRCPEYIFTSRIGVPRADVFGDPDLRAAAELRARAAFP